MDREKFDQVLQDKVQRFEQEYSPVFDGHKVWKGIKRGESRKSWWVIAAASAIIILGLSVLFQQYNRPVEMAKLKKSSVSREVLQIPDAQPRTLKMDTNKPERQKDEFPKLAPKTAEVLNNVNQSIVVIGVSDNSLQRADSNQAQIVKVAEPLMVKARELPLVGKDTNSEIKVTFKRGNSVKVTLPEETKLAFRKFKLRIFENQTYDTAYASGAEVKADRKFRIKF